jgi:hypothetical protein
MFSAHRSTANPFNKRPAKPYGKIVSLLFRRGRGWINELRTIACWIFVCIQPFQSDWVLEISVLSPLLSSPPIAAGGPAAPVQARKVLAALIICPGHNDGGGSGAPPCLRFPDSSVLWT